MKSLNPLVLTVLSSVVLATGAAAWNANATNNVQDTRIETIEKQHAEAQRTQRELTAKMAEQNAQLAVLIERLANLQEHLREQR